MLKLHDKRTRHDVYVFNTHFVFPDINMRESQANLVVRTVKPLAEKETVIFMGDLNVIPARLDMPNLPFYDGDNILRILSEGNIKDARLQSLLGHIGPIATFTNKDGEAEPFVGYGTPGIMLDRIYVSKQVKVLVHAVEPTKIDGHFPSDHMPVLIDCLID